MASAFDLPADDWDEPDEPWFCEPKDKDPAGEFRRQSAFVNWMRKHAKAVDVMAVPNSRKGTGWEKLQRWREGAVAGALDLVISWEPTRPGDRGVYFPEFKDGQKMPTRAQRDRLNSHFRKGHGCGVYRTPKTLIAHLRAAGCPVP